MRIIIEQVNDTTFKVDYIEVVKDQNNNWIAKSELTVNQISAFQKHLHAVENFGVKGKAEYSM